MLGEALLECADTCHCRESGVINVGSQGSGLLNGSQAIGHAYVFRRTGAWDPEFVSDYKDLSKIVQLAKPGASMPISTSGFFIDIDTLQDQEMNDLLCCEVGLTEIERR
jgi:hypothetical protein